jgi:TATA box binding protein associated factor (TAF)
MSGHITPALISAIAESIGVPELSPEAASILAPDVEYRIRDILQVCTGEKHRVACASRSRTAGFAPAAEVARGRALAARYKGVQYGSRFLEACI